MGSRTCWLCQINAEGRDLRNNTKCYLAQMKPHLSLDAIQADAPAGGSIPTAGGCGGHLSASPKRALGRASMRRIAPGELSLMARIGMFSIQGTASHRWPLVRTMAITFSRSAMFGAAAALIALTLGAIIGA